ncbi:hypothetical protein M0R36_04045 [bacterium]|jgi:hypothetical protein|nr:hypothetical protein [bacterium]
MNHENVTKTIYFSILSEKIHGITLFALLCSGIAFILTFLPYDLLFVPQKWIDSLPLIFTHMAILVFLGIIGTKIGKKARLLCENQRSNKTISTIAILLGRTIVIFWIFVSIFLFIQGLPFIIGWLGPSTY